MKRSCATCLWWPHEGKYMACHNPDAWSDPHDPEHWCSLWGPRDRSLVRCETCEWWRTIASQVDENTVGNCQHHALPVQGDGWLRTYSIDRCSNWRLREERDDV